MKKYIKSIARLLDPRWQTIHLDYPVRAIPRYGHGAGPAHSILQTIIKEEEENFIPFLNKVIEYKKELLSIPVSDQSGKSPSWINPFFPGLDTAMLYTIISSLKPKRYIEVGSGHSTFVAYRAIQDHKLATQITSIDPHPRAEISAIVDQNITTPFEDCDLTDILSLGEGDILFIDNSHRVLPNSDATRFFLEVLPRLNRGVWVHLHDIYLPFDYPTFMCERYYSEQYTLAAFIMANPTKYKTRLANYWISQQAQCKAILAPLWQELPEVETHGGSYWLSIEN